MEEKRKGRGRGRWYTGRREVRKKIQVEKSEGEERGRPWRRNTGRRKVGERRKEGRREARRQRERNKENEIGKKWKYVKQGCRVKRVKQRSLKSRVGTSERREGVKRREIRRKMEINGG